MVAINLYFNFSFQPLVELAPIDHRPPMRSRADFLRLVERSHAELEPPSFALRDLGLRAHAMARRGRGDMLNVDSDPDRAFPRVQESRHRIHRRHLHHPDHRRRGHHLRERGFEFARQMALLDDLFELAFRPNRYRFHGFTQPLSDRECKDEGFPRVPRLPPKSHRVQFLHYPRDPIISPERLACDDKRGHTERAVALGFVIRGLKVPRTFAFEVAPEALHVEAGFMHHARDRRHILDIELALEETLEDAVGVGAKLAVPIRPHPAHHRQPRIEQLLRAADDDAALVRVAARIEVQIPDLAPVALRALLQLSAVSLARIEVARQIAQPHAMGLFEAIRRFHRQVSERTLVVEVKLDDFEMLGHDSPPPAIAEIRRRKKWREAYCVPALRVR